MSHLDLRDWRKRRTVTYPQRVFLDALTCKGRFADRYKPKERKNGPPVMTPRVLYGGAGFGGKSHGLRTGAVELNGDLRARGFPGRWGVIFCKTYPNLMDRQVRMLQKEFADIGRVRKTQLKGLFFEFYDPSMGGFYLRNVGQDPDQQRGVEYDWLLMDELTQFMRFEYDSIMYLLRSGDNIPYLAFGAATNPDGIGHSWVKQHWIDRDFGDQQSMIDDGVFDPMDYVFVPAKATDNPAFNASVAAALQGFDDPMIVKSRWDGSWDLAVGRRFGNYSRKVHEFEYEEFTTRYGATPDMDWKDVLKSDSLDIYCSLDYGTADDSASAFYIHVVDEKKNVWTIYEGYWQGTYLESQAAMIVALLKELPKGPVRIYVDPALAVREGDAISRIAKLRRLGVPSVVPAINERISGWATLDSFLNWSKKDVDGEDIPPKWRIHSSCRRLHRFLANAMRDDLRPEDVSRHMKDDHPGDSARYFLHSYFAPGKTSSFDIAGYDPSMSAALRAREKRFNTSQSRLGRMRRLL